MYYGERFNAISHLVGMVLALAGTIVMIVLTALGGDPWKITSAAIYGATLVLLYLFSTLYHSLKGRAKQIMRELDHHSIYLLIAGSYTPLCLVTLRGVWGWSMLGLMWSLAAIGILQEFLLRRGSRRLSMVIYILMGWLAVIPLMPLIRELGVSGMAWLAVGGLFYMVGFVFYILGRTVRHAHGVWHLFVLAGSTTHYLAILIYVL